ncbi:MAG: hypothetical protein WA821_20235 [Anaerolineales bacterium]
MNTVKSIARIILILLVSLALACGALGVAPAQAQAPNGLSAADWKQIKALLPAAAIDAQQAYLKASNPGENDNFGAVIAISGDTLAVGAPYEASNATGINGDQADNSAYGAGAVYVFTRSGSAWSQQAYIKASNAEAGDHFGAAVAISGDTLVVGAYGESSKASGVNGDQADNSAYEAGAAYVFTRSGSDWSQQAYLKASNPEGGDAVNWIDGDMFGASVAISGDTLVVGATGEDSNASGVNGDQTNNLAGSSGAAYVFARSGSVWSQQAYLKASNTEQWDWFGASIALDGDTLVVGATGEDSNATGVNGDQADNSASDSGAAYVFTRNGSDWSQQAYLKASNPDGGNPSSGGGDLFGEAIALSGDTLLVGAPGEDSSATGVNGDQTDNSAYNSGAAYVFTRSATTWSQQAYIKASNTGGGELVTRQGGDMFGSAAAISGDRLIVGAPGESSAATGVNGDQGDGDFSSGSGAAYVFTRNGSVWGQQAYVKASNTERSGSNPSSDDQFGSAVAISGDTVSAGAPYEDSNAPGVNGDQTNNSAADSGAAYVLLLPPLATSSLRADADPSAAASLHFTVTFSEPMTGVDTSDFALTTTGGVTGASVTGVSGGPAANYTYTVTVDPGSGEGTIRLDVKDDDTILDADLNPLGGVGAGNGDFTSGEAYTIDRTPPTVLSMVRADSNPTRAANVHFTVTFSEAVTGVDAADFTPTVTGLTGATITDVSGSDDTYTVTASTGAGSGAIRVDLIDNASIQDLATNPLAGGNFTSGETYTVNKTNNTWPLDITFGQNGIVTTDAGSEAWIKSIAVQPDGKIVDIGSAYIAGSPVFLLERYNADGSPDKTFGWAGGFLNGPGGYGDAIAIQPDGKILASGTSNDGVVLVRYKPNGAPDTSFGDNGTVITQNGGFNTAIIVQPNGQILLSGNYKDDFVVARYNSNGSPDKSFGVNGKALTDFGGAVDRSSAMLLQPDGKIILAGASNNMGFALARYNANGSPDTSFGNRGKLITNISKNSIADDLALQPDGKIVAAGENDVTGLVVLARYNPNGSLDKTFGVAGILNTKISAEMDGNSLAVQPDGRLMVSGDSYAGSAPDAFVLARYKSNGALDTTFGANGVAITGIGDASWAGDTAFQPDGKLIVAGGSSTNGYYYLTLARYNVDYLVASSTASQDGWVLESSENSSVGGSINSAAVTFNLGDDAANKQYLGILSFNTGAVLPDNAVITGVTLKVKKSVPIDPVSRFGGFMVDVKNGTFGAAALQAGDFQSPANATCGPFVLAPLNGWYSIDLTGAKAFINKLSTNAGLTQIRLRFKLDDNNNTTANILSFYSGNASTADRPQLTITYYVP